MEPNWQEKERRDCANGKLAFTETWDYLQGRGVPFENYEKVIASRESAERSRIPFTQTWEYLRGRGVSWENYCEVRKYQSF